MLIFLADKNNIIIAGMITNCKLHLLIYSFHPAKGKENYQKNLIRNQHIFPNLAPEKQVYPTYFKPLKIEWRPIPPIQIQDRRQVL